MISQKFSFLRHQYIGARWLVAPMFWCIIKRSEMLALCLFFGPCLFIQLEGRKWKYVPDKTAAKIKKEQRISSTTVREQYLTIAYFSTPLMSRWSLPFKQIFLYFILFSKQKMPPIQSFKYFLESKPK